MNRWRQRLAELRGGDEPDSASQPYPLYDVQNVQNVQKPSPLAHFERFEQIEQHTEAVAKVITTAEVPGYKLRLDAKGVLVVTVPSPRSPVIDEMLRFNDAKVTEWLSYERDAPARWPSRRDTLPDDGRQSDKERKEP